MTERGPVAEGGSRCVPACFRFFVTSAAVDGGSTGATTGATTGEGEGSGEAAAADGDELRLISLRSGVGAAGDDELTQIGGGGGWAGGGRS
jgi:hypothetical protein